MDNAFCDNNGKGAVLNVEFGNGASLSMSLDSLTDDPLFSEIVLTTQRQRAQPRVEGERIFWSNGASLMINDIIKMILNDD